MKLRNLLPMALLVFSCAEAPPFPPMVDIPAASFRMSATEITNAQYEAFDPSHRALRGHKGFSRADNEAVILVSWEEASAYCEWLSERTGRRFRLPTETE